MTIEAVARLALPEQASESRFHPLTQTRMLWLRKRRRRQRRRPRRQRKPRRSSLKGSGGAPRSAWAGRLSTATGIKNGGPWVRLFDSGAPLSLTSRGEVEAEAQRRLRVRGVSTHSDSRIDPS